MTDLLTPAHRTMLEVGSRDSPGGHCRAGLA